MPFIEANGIRLFYQEAGQGVPLVLLGGTLGTVEGDFAPQIEEFSRGFRVIAPERRGYGRSRPPDREFPDNFYQRDAGDVASIMEALDASRAIVFGWSEGADVSLCLARAYPERVQSLVIWGGIAAVRDEDFTMFEARREVETWPAKLRESMTQIYGEVYWKATWWKWCDVMRKLHHQGGDAMLGRLEEIVCPTLILHGKNDPLIANFHPHRLHSRIKNSRLHEFETGGHNLHLQQTSEFNRVTKEFARASR